MKKPSKPKPQPNKDNPGDLFPRLRHRLLSIALRYLKTRPRSRHETQLRLSQAFAQVSSPPPNAAKLIPQILDLLEKDRFLDDRQFSTSLTTYYLQTKHKGPYFIKQKLHQAGIDRTLINQTLARIATTSAQKKTISHLIHRRQLSLPLSWPQKNKLLRFLASRGFPPALARETIDETLSRKVQ